MSRNLNHHLYDKFDDSQIKPFPGSVYLSCKLMARRLGPVGEEVCVCVCEAPSGSSWNLADMTTYKIVNTLFLGHQRVSVFEITD